MNKIQQLDAPLIKANTTRILKLWKANRDFRMKDATVADFQRVHEEFERLLIEIAARSRELNELRKARERVGAKLRQLCTRAHSGMRGYFGPNSSQYQQISGRPTVKGRKTDRRAKAAAAVGGE